MPRIFQAIRFAIVSSLLVLIAFASGWHAYDYLHAQTRSLRVSTSAPWIVPPGFRTVRLTATPETAEFVAGDRIDVVTTVDDQPAPLILDALVTASSRTTITLLVDREDPPLFTYAQELGLELKYQRTVVPEIAEYASDYFEAEAKYERPVAR